MKSVMEPFVRIRRNLFSIFQYGLIVLLIILATGFVVVILSDKPEWIFRFLGVTEMEEPKYETLKFLGIGMGGVLVALQALMSYKRAKALEDTAKAQTNAVLKTEEGQRQDRLKNAIEHLGHESDSVRLGGAYELFHLAEDMQELCQTVLDILCAHIRWTTGESKYREVHKAKPSEEIQSLLTLLFVQPHGVFDGCHINLQGSWLNGADLSRSHLNGADFTEANLQGTSFYEARLHGALMLKARMQGADLVRSLSNGTILCGARLQGTNLGRACLRGADLFEAQMQGVNLAFAQMQGATIGGAQLQGANLADAELQGVRCEEDISESFEQCVRQSIGQESDLSWVIFGGGLKTLKDIDSLVENLPDDEAHRLRESLKSHIGQPESYELPKDSGVITGAYTENEAKKWIAEYEEAMS